MIDKLSVGYLMMLWPYQHLFNNYSSSPNGLWVNSPLGQRPDGLLTQRLWGREEFNCFSKIQLVGQKYQDKTTLASKTRFSRHCFGFQSRRFSLLVGYNIYPSSSSTNQNAALIIDHYVDFTKLKYPMTDPQN